MENSLLDSPMNIFKGNPKGSSSPVIGRRVDSPITSPRDEKSVDMALAIKDHNPVNKDELDFRKGDLFIILKNRDDFFTVRECRGRKRMGKVPSTMIIVCNKELIDKLESNQSTDFVISTFFHFYKNFLCFFFYFIFERFCKIK